MFQLFFKGEPPPLLHWFGHGRDFLLSLRRMLENFTTNWQPQNKLYSSVLEELPEHRLKKRKFSQQIFYGTHYYLDTTTKSDKMLDLSLPALSLLSQIIKGKINTIKCANDLKKDCRIYEDDYLLFD